MQENKYDQLISTPFNNKKLDKKFINMWHDI